MNTLKPDQRAAVLEAIASGCSIRDAVRVTGVAKGTILRLLKQPASPLDKHIIAANVSTANSRRKRLWEYQGNSEPDGYVVDAACGNPLCSSHLSLRRRISNKTAQPLFAHAFAHVLDLPIGGTVGVAVPDEWEEDAFAVKLRSILHNNQMFWRFRWGVRVREDRVLVVMKLGTWASKKRTYERKPQVEKPAHWVRFEDPAKVAVCLGCGERFDSEDNPFCSERCQVRYEEIAAILREMPL